MARVTLNSARARNLGSFVLKPGVNNVPDAVWNRFKDLPVIKQDREIVPEVAASLVALDKLGASPAPVAGPSAASANESLEQEVAWLRKFATESIKGHIEVVAEMNKAREALAAELTKTREANAVQADLLVEKDATIAKLEAQLAELAKAPSAPTGEAAPRPEPASAAG